MTSLVVIAECPCGAICVTLLDLEVISEEPLEDGTSRLVVRPVNCRWTRGCGHVTPRTVNRELRGTGG